MSPQEKAMETIHHLPGTLVRGAPARFCGIGLLMPCEGFFTPSIHRDQAEGAPSPRSSRLAVAASVTERSVPSCLWPPSCNRMLLPLCRRWLQRMPLCTRAASAFGSVASQSWAVTFHITGVRPSSAAVRSTSGRRAPKGGRNHSTASPVASSMAACSQQAPPERARAVPKAMTDGSSYGSPPGGRLDEWHGQFRDAGARSCQSGKRSHVPDAEPAIQAIAGYRDHSGHHRR